MKEKLCSNCELAQICVGEGVISAEDCSYYREKSKGTVTISEDEFKDKIMNAMQRFEKSQPLSIGLVIIVFAFAAMLKTELFGTNEEQKNDYSFNQELRY